ncbi:hypothetical protein NU219Hw_g1683t1 [Hortaea werneckii]
MSVSSNTTSFLPTSTTQESSPQDTTSTSASHSDTSTFTSTELTEYSSPSPSSLSSPPQQESISAESTTVGGSSLAMTSPKNSVQNNPSDTASASSSSSSRVAEPNSPLSTTSFFASPIPSPTSSSKVGLTSIYPANSVTPQPSSISTTQSPTINSENDLTTISPTESAYQTSSNSIEDSTVASQFPTGSQDVSESIATPKSTFVPECNPGQQYQYTDPSSGNPYVVQCNQTYQGIVGLATYEASAEDCISSCSANSRCLGVGYDTSDGKCNEYYGYAPNSGDQSPTVVFAQLVGRVILVFGESRTRTTTTPISTLYVSASAVTTALPSDIASSSTVASEMSSGEVETMFSSSASSGSDSAAPTSTNQIATPPDDIATTALSNTPTPEYDPSRSQITQTPSSSGGVIFTESMSSHTAGRRYVTIGIGVNSLVNLSRHNQISSFNGNYVVSGTNVNKLADLWEYNNS